MKKKILLIVFVGAVLTFFIYKITYHEEINIVALGDGLAIGQTAYEVSGYSFNDYLHDEISKTKTIAKYIREFAVQGETSTTLKTKISNNFTLESDGTKIQQAIANASILTIALGMDELNQKNLKSKQIDNYLQNMEKILTVIRIYNNKKIYLLSLYPTSFLNSQKVTAINTKLQELCTNHQVIFIDITSVVQQSDYFFNPNSFYLNYKGHRYISELIQKKL